MKKQRTTKATPGKPRAESARAAPDRKRADARKEPRGTPAPAPRVEPEDRSRVWILGSCFVLSGATGLVYEVLWSRHLQVLFGSTTEAVSVVLATFMTGLGLGAHFLGARADRARSPLALYGFCEIGIGVYALLTGPLLSVATSLNDRLAGGMTTGSLPATLLKVGLSALALLPPAFLMGGTLPALLRGVSRSRDEARRLVGVLYGLNTFGAVAGTGLAGFVLLELLGLTFTMRLAGVFNIALGGTVIALRRRLEVKSEEASPAGEEAETRGTLRVLLDSTAGRYALLGLFVSGATTMLYEVVFTRVLGLVFGVSSYAFTMVLVIFLMGLALGAWIQTAGSRRWQVRLAQFGGTQVLVSVLGALALLLIPAVPRIVITARQTPGMGFWNAFLVKAVIATGFVLPLAVVAGIGLPLLLTALAEDLRRLGRIVGNATMVNTAGTVTGSLATGFLLVPLLGSEVSLRIAVVVSALTGLLGLLIDGGRTAKRAGAALAAAMLVFAVLAPRWPAALFLVSDTGRLGLVETKLDLEMTVRAGLQEVLFFEEGRNATVAVTKSPQSRTLVVSGHPDASDLEDMSTQVLHGVIPMVTHTSPQDVLVVGFGSGVTAEVVARLPDVKRIDLVELESAVMNSAPHFSHVNHGVEKSPKLHLVLDDARSFVRATRQRYDVIVSEPSNPWRAGVANVFTAEFFRSARAVMKPGGLFAQWVQLYDIDDRSLRLVFRTFVSVFPETQLWLLDRGNLMLMGSESPVVLRRDRVESLVGGLYADDCYRYGRLRAPGELFARFLLSTRALKEFAGEGPIHGDDRPLLEFEAPRGVFLADGRNAHRLLAAKLKAGELSAPVVGERPDDATLWSSVAEMYRWIHEPNEARMAYRKADPEGKNVGVLARAGNGELEAGRVGAAETLLQTAQSLAGDAVAAAQLPAFVRRELAYLKARVAVRKGALPDALAAYRETGEMDGPAGIESLRTLIALKRFPDALALAESLLSRARIGTVLGAEAVGEVQLAMLQLLDDRDSARVAADLVARLPASPDFSAIGRVQTLVLLHDAAGQQDKALAAGAEYERLGGLEPAALEAYARALDTAGRSQEARRVERQVKELEQPARKG